MSSITQPEASTFSEFGTPAYQDDFGSPAEYQAFTSFWSANVLRWTQQAIIGNPWSNSGDAPRTWYYNPIGTVMPTSGGVPINWVPFPNRVLTFFTTNPDSSKNLTMDQIYQLVDTGSVEINGVSTSILDMQIPAKGELCPSINWDGPTQQWYPQGPRGWLDEYCEFSVTRNADGKITSIMFTCENPEYWFSLWQWNPEIVLALYQKHINPAVKIEDLYLTDDQGNPVIDPVTGRVGYNATNKWNVGTVTGATSGGAMHLTSPPNTLGAEVYLAAAATMARSAAASSNPQNLICCAQYGQNFRNSDPHIGFLANQVVMKNQLSITLMDPIGLYIQDPDFSSYATPDGTDPSTFWTVTRGQKGGMTLHAVYEVPADKGYTVSDITIGGAPIQWACQMQNTFKIQLMAVGQAAASLPPVTDCVTAQPDSTVQPWPNQLISWAMFQAGSALTLAATPAQNSQLTDMALIVIGGKDGAGIWFSADGQTVDPDVTWETTQYVANAGGGVPGQSFAAGVQAYVGTLTVSPNAPPGDRYVKIVNNGGDPDTVPWAAGLLSILPRT